MKRETVTFNGVEYHRYPDSPHRSRRVYFYAHDKSLQGLHQEVWKFHNGRPIPPGMMVHHRDDNPLNNDPANLELVSRDEHAERHRGQCSDRKREHLAEVRPKASEWHRSAEGRAWHSQNAKKSWIKKATIRRTCIQCGGEYENKTNRGNERFCSVKCINKYHEVNRTYFEDRACVVCGATFSVKKSQKQVCCSRKCSWVVRRGKAIQGASP